MSDEKRLSLRDTQVLILIARMTPVFRNFPLARKHRYLLVIDSHLRLPLETVLTDTGLFDIFSHMRSTLTATEEGKQLLQELLCVFIDGRTSRRLMCSQRDVVNFMRRYIEVSQKSFSGPARRALLAYFHKASETGKALKKKVNADKMSLTRLRNTYKGHSPDNFLLPLYAGQIYAGLRQIE